ncbi:G-protein coupled receptor Mth isoform X1 [Drosophila virilis]|uniref:G-protein coupled receptor Mth isoform X1 n=1 Tax=Drosophila virilis TaxID=7244 RepID=UPI00139647F6|nr:G-protein coupled receptor Mth isoform X1 [Drosophila virilis]
MKSGLVLTLLFLEIVAAQIPGCDYFDTVDLSHSPKLSNGSYQYEGLVIPPEQTGEYDFEILADGEKESVPRHLRGCACRLGSCIRFCCHRNLFLDRNERTCSGDIAKAVDYDPYVNISLANGTQVRRHVLKDFIVQQDLPVPCSEHFHLDALNDESHGWTLMEDGRLLRHFDQKSLSKQEYCLQPHPISAGDNKTVITLVPHNCNDPPESQLLYNILRLLSIICLLSTIIVYLFIPKLRNLHGCCFTCYMASLLIAYALLLVDSWKEDWSKSMCQLNGYVGYFAVMASFLWLTVISFDLWSSFRSNNYNVQRYTPRYRFLIYSLYAWGVAALLTLIVIIVDYKLDDNDDDELFWMPGVGLYNCWVKTHDWSALLYFHGPMALQILFNIIMFILTAIRILEVKRDLQNVAAHGEREQRLNSERQTYTLFMRLFVIMGVTWTFEIFAYFAQNQKILEKIFSFFDYINCAQGVIIFIMFVLKSSVLRLISNRIRGIESAEDGSDSEEEIALQDRNGAVNKIGPNILN